MPYIETQDRTRLYYRDWGTGRPVVFVSSWALGGDMWEYQALPLSEQGLCCITYDRRGHGRSDDPGHGYDFDTLADDLAELIEQLDLREVTLAGHSMGCAEIARYLSRHGTRRVVRAALISSIRLVRAGDTPERLPESAVEAAIAGLRADRALYFTSGATKFFGLGAKWPRQADISPEMVRWGVELIMQSSPKAVVECWRATFQDDFHADVAAFTMPTLIIHGDNDRNSSIEIGGRRLAQAIPGSRFLIYEGAPHGLFFTDRERLARDLLAFIADA